MEYYSVKNRFKIGLILGFFFAFTVFFYGPIGIYLSNAEELKFGLSSVLRDVTIVSVIFLALAVLISLIVPKKLFRWYSLLFLGGGIAFYVQGNYINHSYGVLDGASIDWSSYTGYGILNTAVWLICILLPFIAMLIFGRKKEEKLIAKAVCMVALFLVVIQIPAMIVQMTSYKKKDTLALEITDHGLFDMSAEENIVVFVVDTMDERFYEKYLKEHPEFETNNDGFVHYDNAMTGGARTMLGMPIMLTGVPYEREESYSEYINKIYSDDNNVLAKMSEAGYDVKVYSETLFYSQDTEKYVSNFELVTRPVVSYYVLGKKLYKLSLFKFMPHFLKKRFWMETSEFESAMKAEDSYDFNDAIFYEKYKKRGITVDENLKKNFIVYHMRGMHVPYNIDENGIQQKSVKQKQQIAGCFTIIQSILDGMKESGVYDNSTIMITADHGAKKYLNKIMLMLKEKGATGECTYNGAPVSSFDFPIYFTSLAGQTLTGQKYGVDMMSLKEDEVRTRYFYRNTSDNSRVVVQKYETSEHAKEGKAMKLVDTFQDDAGKPYELGTPLSFDADATGNTYAVEGFGDNTGFRTRIHGPKATLVIPFAKKPEKTVKATLKLFERNELGRELVIEANGHEVYRKQVGPEDASNNITFEIDPSCFEDNTLTLDFLTPELSQDEMNEKVTDRTETLSFVTLIFE